MAVQLESPGQLFGKEQVGELGRSIDAGRLKFKKKML
jgi:hypothetical protein